jgi:hypothetical protein
MKNIGCIHGSLWLSIEITEKGLFVQKSNHRIIILILFDPKAQNTYCEVFTAGNPGLLILKLSFSFWLTKARAISFYLLKPAIYQANQQTSCFQVVFQIE